MIPRADEIQRAMTGCFAVLRRDPDAMRYFGDDAGAFLRSFFASVLVLPLQILIPSSNQLQPAVTGGPLIVIMLLTYAISWLFWPAVMDVAARVIDRDAQYFRYITAFNWAQVPLTLVLLLAASIAPPLMIVAFILALTFLVFLTAQALEISLPAAIALMALYLALDMTLQFTALSMAGIAPSPAG